MKRIFICFTVLFLVLLVSCDPSSHGREKYNLVSDIKFKGALRLDENCKRSLTTDSSSAELDKNEWDALDYDWYFRASSANVSNVGKEYGDEFYKINMFKGGAPEDKLVFYVGDLWNFEVLGFCRNEEELSIENALFYSYTKSVLMTPVTTVDIQADYTTAGNAKFFNPNESGYLKFEKLEYIPSGSFDHEDVKLTIKYNGQTKVFDNLNFVAGKLSVSDFPEEAIELLPSKETKPILVSIDYYDGSGWQNLLSEYALHSQIAILSGVTTWMTVGIYEER